MKNDDLYRKFDDVYKKNWIAYKDDEGYRKPLWEIAKIVCIVLVLAFLIGIIYCYVVGELYTELCLCALIFTGTIIVFFVDKRIYAKEYLFLEKMKMKCVESTICELLNCSSRDIQRIKTFIEKFDDVSKKTIPYRIYKFFSRLISGFLVLYAFIIAEIIDYDRIPHPIVGLILIFVLQELFHSGIFNSLFTHERYYQKLVRRYNEEMVDEYLKL